MADGDDTPKTDGEQKTFTQAEVDRIVGERLKRAEETYATRRAEEEKKRAESERIAKLQGDEKIRAEYESKLKDYETKLAEQVKASRTLEAQTELARAGLPGEFTGFVIGDTTAETVANVKRIRELVDAEVTRLIDSRYQKGAPKDPTGQEVDSVREAIFKGAGLIK